MNYSVSNRAHVIQAWGTALYNQEGRPIGLMHAYIHSCRLTDSVIELFK